MKMSPSTCSKLSLTNIYKRIIIILIPIVIVGLSVTLFVYQNVLANAERIVEDNFRTNVTALREDFNRINYMIMDQLNNNSSLEDLHSRDATVFQKNYAIGEFQSRCTMLQNYLGDQYHFFTYDPVNGSIYSGLSASMEYYDKKEAEKLIQQYMRSSTEQENRYASSHKWSVVGNTEPQPLFIKVYTNNDYSMGCWVRFQDIEKMWRVNTYSDNQDSLIISNEFEIIYSNNPDVKIGSDVANLQNGRGGIYYDAFGIGDFSFWLISDAIQGYSGGNIIISLLLVYICIIVIIGLIMLYYIRSVLVRPILNFTDAITHWEDEPNETGGKMFTELAQLNTIFKDTRQQIKDIKISMYEQVINRNKLELQYHQLQIKPHFYLNCLNIIYSMAELQNYKAIQMLSKEVSHYFRTIFQDGLEKIPLEKEMEHVDGYLRIQKIRYEDAFSYKISYDTALNEFKIIPLVIHTLIENSIKHTIMKKKSIMIYLDITRIIESDMDFIVIEARDNGGGFPPDILAQLQDGNSLITKEGKRVGLANLILRLTYAYDGKAKISFFNDKSSGAIVKVVIPV